ncbi:hypothetical protein FRB91_002606 [Serendipita sp. 411]|nr:hypothetical protein FRB91_002606 [Serendipita sp. 411]
MMHFCGLPNELIEQIFLHLYPLDIVSCQLVSRQLHNLIESSCLLQLLLEAALDGILLAPNTIHARGPLTSGELLSRLIQTRNAWKSSRPLSLWSIPYSGSTLRYEICDGILAISTKVVLQDSPTSDIVFVELASPNMKPGYIHFLRDIAMEIRDITMLPAADLVVLLEGDQFSNKPFRIHFKAISNGNPHPLAAKSVLEALDPSLQTLQEHGKALIMLNHDTVVLFVSEFTTWTTRRAGFMAWNWKTGNLITPYRHALDGVFLSRYQMLLVVDFQNQHLEWSDISSMGLVVYDFRTSKITHVVQLPVSSIPCAILYTYAPQSVHLQSPAEVAASFTPDPSLDIIVLEFGVNRLGHDFCFVIFSVRHLIDACDRMPAEQFGTSSATIKWEDWGAHGSRWFPENSLTCSGERAIFGSRMITSGTVSLQDNQISIPGPWSKSSSMILDFNPRPIRRTALDSTDHIDGFKTVPGTSRWTVTQWNGEEVSIDSSLPFRMFVFDFKFHTRKLHLHHSAIVAQQAQSYDIYSFLPDPVYEDGENTLALDSPTK